MVLSLNRHSREDAGLSGEIFSARIAGLGLRGIALKSSCADLIRASTPLFRALKDVDAHGTNRWAEGPRAKPGQDENRGPISSFSQPQDFPRTALREGR